MESDETKTVSSGLDLYVNQCSDVSKMKTSLLSCNKNDPDSARKAIQYITADLTYPVISEERYADLTDLDGEVWLPVAEYTKYSGETYTLLDGYLISNMGRFKRLAHIQEYDRNHVHICANIPERMLRRHEDMNGYYRVAVHSTHSDRPEFLASLARLVAATFIRKFTGTEEVDHLNKNRKDDRLSNLEIVSGDENRRRASTTSRPGYFEECPDIIFPSQLEACKALGRDPTYISTCTHGGYALHPKWNRKLSFHWKECKR